MKTAQLYTLPLLPYGYKDLEPYMSEIQLMIHHQKHHQAYVNASNSISETLYKARETDADVNVKAVLKDLSFNMGGHILHALFWNNLAPSGKGGGVPGGVLGDAIEKEFRSFGRFKKEFTQAAVSVEGSGWAALSYDNQTRRPIIMQIEKHNTNVYPTLSILMVFDVFEHAYYIDYKNDRAKFVDALWNIVNWSEVERRLKEQS